MVSDGKKSGEGRESGSRGVESRESSPFFLSNELSLERNNEVSNPAHAQE